MPRGNPNWHKGMAKVPGSGRKKGVRNKRTEEVRRATRLATLEMARRTPAVVEQVSELIANPDTNLWAKVKLIEIWMRHSMPIPQVKVETGAVKVDNAGDLAVTVIRTAQQDAKVLDSPPDSTSDDNIIDVQPVDQTQN